MNRQRLEPACLNGLFIVEFLNPGTKILCAIISITCFLLAISGLVFSGFDPVVIILAVIVSAFGYTTYRQARVPTGIRLRGLLIGEDSLHWSLLYATENFDSSLRKELTGSIRRAQMEESKSHEIEKLAQILVKAQICTADRFVINQIEFTDTAGKRHDLRIDDMGDPNNRNICEVRNGKIQRINPQGLSDLQLLDHIFVFNELFEGNERSTDIKKTLEFSIRHTSLATAAKAGIVAGTIGGLAVSLVDVIREGSIRKRLGSTTFKDSDLPHEWWTRAGDSIMAVEGVHNGTQEVHTRVQDLGGTVGQ